MDVPRRIGFPRGREPENRLAGRALAEDLTTETFLGAVDTVHRAPPPRPTAGWLVGIARHKLADHWRRLAVEQRGLRLLGGDLDETHDPWEREVNALQARHALGRLAPQHRAVLTLRYLDGLPVAEVADHLGRTVRATETLLRRAKHAFRRCYVAEEGSDDRSAD